MNTYEFECGEIKGCAEGDTAGAAWRKLTARTTKGFAPLARWRELIGIRMVWKYQTPQSLDATK